MTTTAGNRRSPLVTTARRSDPIQFNWMQMTEPAMHLLARMLILTACLTACLPSSSSISRAFISTYYCYGWIVCRFKTRRDAMIVLLSVIVATTRTLYADDTSRSHSIHHQSYNSGPASQISRQGWEVDGEWCNVWPRVRRRRRRRRSLIAEEQQLNVLCTYTTFVRSPIDRSIAGCCFVPLFWRLWKTSTPQSDAVYSLFNH